MATYVNDLRLKEIGTGDSSGTWGTETNTNLELIGEALGFGTEAITTNADTHTTLVADGGTDPGRAIYIKYTGTLDSTCTITISPNTMSRMHFIENGTSGSQDIAISQGTGSNVTIPAGDVKAVYLDGAGSGAAVNDAFASLNVVDLKVQDDLTVTDDLIVNGDIDLEGAIDVNGTANLDVVDIDGAVDMASTLQVDGAITSSAGATITLADNTDNLTLTSTDADAAVGPNLRMYRNSGSPADNDYIGEIQFEGRNDNSQDVVYAGLATRIVDASDGTEDGRFELYTILAGAQISRVLANSTETVINQDSADLDFRVESNGNANMLFVDAGNDRLGVGTASPGTDVHIYSAADNAPHLLLENFQNADTDDAAVIELYLNDQTTGGIGDDTDVGVIRFTGDEKDGGTKETYAEIRGVAHDPGQGASNKGNLSFFVQTAGDLNETLKLDEDKVVIGGDAVPDELLHIYDRNAAPKIRFEQFDSSGAPTSGDVVGGIEWSINDDSSFSGADTVRTKILSVIEGTTAQTALTFSTGASSAASAEKMRLTNDGKLTVGATTASHKIEAHSGGIGTKYDGTNHVAIRGLSGGQYIQYSSSTALSFVAVDTYPNSGASTKAQIATNGDFYTNDGTVSSLSDERIKTNVIDLSDGLEIVNQLRPITYEYNNEFESDADLGVKDGVTRYGFIAQEVETIAPQYVNQSEGKINGESVDDLRSLSQTKMIPMLVKSIQEQQEQIEELKQQINELRGN
jgi:hypothetical protein